MSDDAGQEPSMEEILASIRKIISEDGEEDGAEEVVEAEAEPEPEPEFEPEPEPEPEPEFEPEPEPEPEPEVDMLELTEEFVEAPLPVQVEPEEFEDDLILDDEDLVSAATTATGAETFASLAGALDPRMRTGDLNRTLEDLVKEVMRPLLRNWLEANLPVVVERLVKREIDKMASKPK